MKMLKYITAGVLLMGAAACTHSEIEDVFGASPEERIAQLQQDYNQILAYPEYGWKGYYGSVNKHGGYLVLLRFEDGKVTIKSEAVGLIKYPESEETITYHVGVKQRPELVFESYSLFQAWHGAIVGGELLKDGEFVFNFDKITQDEVILKSKSDLKDITYLRLTPAKKTDWSMTGLSDMERKLYAVSPATEILNQKLVGGSYARFVELDAANRMLYLEEAPGKAKAHRYGVSRRGIVLLDTLYAGGEAITEFIYDESRRTIVSDSPTGLTVTTDENYPIEYVKPSFADELRPAVPEAFPTPKWMYVKHADLKNVKRLEVTLKNYQTFYGLEFLPNLEDFRLVGVFSANPRVDLSKNLKLKKVLFLMNTLLDRVDLSNLPELEEVTCTSNPMLKELDLRTSAAKLKRVVAHMNNAAEFRLNVSGAAKLLRLEAQQNGWTAVDITGCSSLREVLLNSGNSTENESADVSHPTMTDITGLSAAGMPLLEKLFVPLSAKLGDNVKRFYFDTKAEGRKVLMMYGHSLIKPDTHPQYIYTDATFD